MLLALSSAQGLLEERRRGRRLEHKFYALDIRVNGAWRVREAGSGNN